MPGREPLEHIVTFCGKGDCGARIQLSLAQLHDLVSDVKEGALDKLFVS
jgi:hypothetical protein